MGGPTLAHVESEKVLASEATRATSTVRPGTGRESGSAMSDILYGRMKNMTLQEMLAQES